MLESEEKKSRFPKLTIEKCREAVKGRKEFRETIKDNLIGKKTLFFSLPKILSTSSFTFKPHFHVFLNSKKVFNYDFCFGETFPDPKQAPDKETEEKWKVRRECRGLIFDLKSGKLLARRFHKFFNLNESKETLLENLDLREKKYVFVEKKDGCLISAVLLEGEVKFASKNGPTSLSLSIEQNYFKKNPSCLFHLFAREWVEKGFTPIFEWCSPLQQIVLKYEKEELVLIGLREMESGRYLSHHSLLQAASPFNIPVVPSFSQSSPNDSIQQVVEKVKKAEGIEGCVLMLEEGGECVEMYKIKSEWYFAQSKAHLALPTSEREMWSVLLSNQMDDILPKLTIEVKEKVNSFSNLLFHRLLLVGSRLSSLLSSLIRSHLLSSSPSSPSSPSSSLLYQHKKDATELVESGDGIMSLDSRDGVMSVDSRDGIVSVESRGERELVEEEEFKSEILKVDKKTLSKILEKHPLRSLLFKLYDNPQSVLEAVVEWMSSNCTAKKFESTRKQLQIEDVNFFQKNEN